MLTEKKMSTSKMPCNDDPNFSFFRCIEAYYSEQRGCQFPWNVDNETDIKICTKYSDISPVLMNFFNRDTGARRETFRISDMLMNAEKHCAPPCFRKKFVVKLDRWSLAKSLDKPTTSLKIVLDGFAIKHEEEFLKCDSTCIIGEVGGNLGFFVGGSILLGLDMILLGIKKLTTTIQKKRSKLIKNTIESKKQTHENFRSSVKINIGKRSTIII